MLARWTSWKKTKRILAISTAASDTVQDSAWEASRSVSSRWILNNSQKRTTKEWSRISSPKLKLSPSNKSSSHSTHRRILTAARILQYPSDNNNNSNSKSIPRHNNTINSSMRTTTLILTTLIDSTRRAQQLETSTLKQWASPRTSPLVSHTSISSNWLPRIQCTIGLTGNTIHSMHPARITELPSRMWIARIVIPSATTTTIQWMVILTSARWATTLITKDPHKEAQLMVIILKAPTLAN